MTCKRNTWQGFMQSCFSQGFTLIGLLVVVLIIGILVTIALPQYQRAVEKSRGVQVLALLKALGQAQEAYYVANGEYATTFGALDVVLPGEWTSGGSFYNWKTTDTHTNGEWVIQLSTDGGHSGNIIIGRPEGHAYQGSGFSYTNFHDSASRLRGKIICEEIKSHGVKFKKPEGSYCQKLFNGKIYSCPDCVTRRYTL